MQITKKLIIVGAGIVVLAGGGGAAYAATSSASAAPVAPKVTAAQAIDIALKQVPGAWVSELDFDLRGQRADTWELELTKGAEQHEVAVDATSGKVTDQQKSQDDDRDDQDDDNDDD